MRSLRERESHVFGELSQVRRWHGAWLCRRRDLRRLRRSAVGFGTHRAVFLGRNPHERTDPPLGGDIEVHAMRVPGGVRALAAEQQGVSRPCSGRACRSAFRLPLALAAERRYVGRTMATAHKSYLVPIGAAIKG